MTASQAPVMGSSRILRSFVGNSWVDGAQELEDTNPAMPSHVVAIVSVANAAVASSAVASAAQAFGDWRARPAPSRGEILRRTADILEARHEAVATDLANEEGKPYAEAAGEVLRAVAVIRYYAAAAFDPDGETYPSHSGNTFLYARREPIGVVTAITPWNFPIAIPAWKIAPALVYGNTVVWKPAEIVPLTAVNLLQAFVDAGLPAGVLNVVLGRGSEIGNVLTDDPAVAAITFTGSNAVGNLIRVRAAQQGKRSQLEMGGKNPAIVLADAHIEHAAEQVARGAFLSAGQKCTATSRVIVERKVLPEFQARLAATAIRWRLGAPLDPQTMVGPMSSEAQMNTVIGYLNVGKTEGADVAAGGCRDEALGAGYYLKPTVLINVHPGSRVATEEIFGPVAALLPADSFDEAINLANMSSYGLTASLFTKDLGRAMKFASDVRAGVVKVNQETAGLEFQAPFGGMKASSSGSREQGKAAREFFTEWKTVYLDRPPS